jgi:hypothetical protein
MCPNRAAVVGTLGDRGHLAATLWPPKWKLCQWTTHLPQMVLALAAGSLHQKKTSATRPSAAKLLQLERGASEAVALVIGPQFRRVNPIAA